MAWNARRNQIVAAVDSTVQVFNMRDPGELHFMLYEHFLYLLFRCIDWPCWFIAKVLHIPESSFII